MGLLASPALVQVTCGTVYVQVVNVGTNNVVLYPHNRLGQVCSVSIASLPKGICEGQLVSTTSSLPSAMEDQIKELDLSPLTDSDQVQVHALLFKYHSVFSLHDSDLGCTNLIPHDVPLLELLTI